jgi:hypothetical protein
MSTTITVQPGQPGMGMDYDVRQPLPYPFHIDADTGRCVRGRGTADLGEAPEDQPWGLVGFQRGNVQRLVLTVDDFVRDPQAAVGLVPVFVGNGSIFALTVPVTDVTDHRRDDGPTASDAA